MSTATSPVVVLFDGRSLADDCVDVAFECEQPHSSKIAAATAAELSLVPMAECPMAASSVGSVGRGTGRQPRLLGVLTIAGAAPAHPVAWADTTTQQARPR
jgi:hypothetical protein